MPKVNIHGLIIKLNLNWFNVDFNNFDNTINDVENKIKRLFF